MQRMIAFLFLSLLALPGHAWTPLNDEIWVRAIANSQSQGSTQGGQEIRQGPSVFLGYEREEIATQGGARSRAFLRKTTGRGGGIDLYLAGEISGTGQPDPAIGDSGASTWISYELTFVPEASGRVLLAAIGDGSFSPTTHPFTSIGRSWPDFSVVLDGQTLLSYSQETGMEPVNGAFEAPITAGQISRLRVDLESGTFASPSFTTSFSGTSDFAVHLLIEEDFCAACDAP